MMPARMACKSFCARNWADLGLWAAGHGFWCSVSRRGCLPRVPLWDFLWSSWHGSARAGLLWDAEVCHSTSWNSGGVISLRPLPVERGPGQGFIPPTPSGQPPRGRRVLVSHFLPTLWGSFLSLKPCWAWKGMKTSERIFFSAQVSIGFAFLPSIKANPLTQTTNHIWFSLYKGDFFSLFLKR